MLYYLYILYMLYCLYTTHELFFFFSRGLGILVRVRMQFLFLAGVCIRLAFRCGHVLLSVWVWFFLSSWAL
jgi:hypothetical protein